MHSARLLVSAGLVAALFAGVALGADLPNAWWRFEEGTAGSLVPEWTSGPKPVVDSIGNRNLRRANGAEAPTYRADVPINVIPRTGAPNNLSLQFVRANTDDLWSDGWGALNNPTIPNGYTIEAAFKTTRVNNFQVIVGKDRLPKGVPGATVDLEQTLSLKVRGDTGKLQIEFWDESGTRRQVTSTAALVANQWYYAAVVNDNATCKLYLDRRDGQGYVLQGEVAVTGDATPAGNGLYTINSVWAIGRGQYGLKTDGTPKNADWFDGWVDEVRISNVPLTVAEFLFSQPFKRGDLNRDNKVDSEDVRIFNNCSLGPEIPHVPAVRPPGCDVAPGAWEPDFDNDGDADQADFGILQQNYTG